MTIISSMSLKRFVKQYGIQQAVDIWGVSQQAVDKAYKGDRDIQIIELDGYIEVRESRLLNRTRINGVKK